MFFSRSFISWAFVLDYNLISTFSKITLNAALFQNYHIDWYVISGFGKDISCLCVIIGSLWLLIYSVDFRTYAQKFGEGRKYWLSAAYSSVENFFNRALLRTDQFQVNPSRWWVNYPGLSPFFVICADNFLPSQMRQFVRGMADLRPISHRPAFGFSWKGMKHHKAVKFQIYLFFIYSFFIFFIFFVCFICIRKNYAFKYFSIQISLVNK